MPIKADFTGQWKFYNSDQGQEIVTAFDSYVDQLVVKEQEQTPIFLASEVTGDADCQAREDS